MIRPIRRTARGSYAVLQHTLGGRPVWTVIHAERGDRGQWPDRPVPDAEIAGWVPMVDDVVDVLECGNVHDGLSCTLAPHSHGAHRWRSEDGRQSRTWIGGVR